MTGRIWTFLGANIKAAGRRGSGGSSLSLIGDMLERIDRRSLDAVLRLNPTMVPCVVFRHRARLGLRLGYRRRKASPKSFTETVDWYPETDREP